MDSEEEQISMNEEQSLNYCSYFATLVVMSSISNTIFIHINIDKENIKDRLLIDMKTNKNDEECSISYVYDVNAVTKSLNTSQIIKLIDESIDINQCYNLKNHIKLKS